MKLKGPHIQKQFNIIVKPLHKFKILNQNREYPVADKEWLRLVSLPCHNCMNEEDIDYVIYWVKEFYKEKVNV